MQILVILGLLFLAPGIYLVLDGWQTRVQSRGVRRAGLQRMRLGAAAIALGAVAALGATVYLLTHISF